MTTRRFDSGEEPFIDSLRERVQQTKAENARLRASAPVPARVDEPLSEEAQRALKKTRALAVIGEGPRSVRGLWPVLLLLAVLVAGAVLAVRFGLIAAPVRP